MSDTMKASIIGALITGGISLLIFFLGDFSTQTNFEKNTVEVFSKYFTAVDDKMSYEEAIQTIYEENKGLKKRLNKYEELITNYQGEISTNNSKGEIENLVRDATQYWENSEYIQALILLKNSCNMSEDVRALYQQFSNEYSNKLLTQVDLLLKQRDNDRALEILKGGAELVYDKSIISNKISSILNAKSELLSNLTPVSGEVEYVWDSSKRDNYGNKYSSGICLHQNYDKPAHVVYSLDGKYTMLTGKFVLEEKSKNTDGKYVLYVYSLVDGNMTLLYESKVLTTATRPIDVEINVTGVMDIVVEVYDPKKESNNADVGLVDVMLAE